ncbi:HD domain-containing protein [Candidatus Tisiphia endosymbiont of Nemotelus uliginosus]|uniref:HD domain-containing protein n=1 Tax=Candidatus Tisiphia endosymbiont of Nemotelus uliginosus TaxID=3077926 RepID=UPI0035C91E9B
MLTQSIVKLNEEKLQEAIDYIIYRGHYSAYLFEITAILLEIYPTTNTLVAGLLFSTLKEATLPTAILQLQEISNNFGGEVANIVEAVIKLSTINYLPYDSTQGQKFYDLLMLMSEKMIKEVLCIKLSYLVHDISVFNLNPSLKQHITTVLEIMEIYIPLMEKLEFKEIAAELQEICFMVVLIVLRLNLLRAGALKKY